MALLAIQNLSFAYPHLPAKSWKTSPFLGKGVLVLCGATGSGKSTLLRCLKREIAPKGELSGQILYQDQPLSALSERESACRIGFVAQRPQQQIVADKVWHELAFGLENMGLPQASSAAVWRKPPAFLALRIGLTVTFPPCPAGSSSCCVWPQ